MLGEPENQFSLTRAASSTCGRAKTSFLSVGQALLAEDSQVAAVTGSPGSATWLEPDAANALLQITPDTNIAPDIARQHLRPILEGIAAVRLQLDDLARQRGQELLDSHQRVRVVRGVQHRKEPKLPVDILGLYVFLP
jgi:hypothetical protein